ncbi:MAG: esterase [Actinomycetota bacterium]|jgi:CubicO group peptidase (beta-lactamase class C family)
MSLTHEHFESNYSEAVEIFKNINPELKGSQLVVKVQGKTVLDLSAGVSPESLTTVFSVSKALSALAIAKLVTDGKLDFEEKVSHYWPEFAANGKANVTVRQMLSHQAGLIATDPQITVAMIHDNHAAAAALAAQKPLWRPGSGFGYHGLTIGPLMSELCFRITGLTMQQFYDREIRTPANADAYLGLPESLEQRVTELNGDVVPPSADLAARYPRSTAPQSGLASWGAGIVPFAALTNREGRAFGLPSAGGVASARGLADAMQWAMGFGSSVPGVSREVIDDMSQMQVYGYDLGLEQEHRSFGTIFQKSTPVIPFGSYRAIGHDGAAGALLYADPIGEIVFGYTVARFTYPGGFDREIQPIIDLVRRIATAN